MPQETSTAVRQIRAFNRFYTDIIGLLDRHLLDSAYSLAEARIIYEIHAAGQIQASQIMQAMHIDKSYLSRILQKLERSKLIAKKPSPQDARAIMLTLTPKGIKEFHQLNQASDKQIQGLIAALPTADWTALVAHMQSIMQLLQKH